MVTHTSSQGTPSTRWGVRYCASLLDRCSDRMRHTVATVFSRMDGAVGRAPFPPPVYRREDDLARVREVLHQVLGSQFPRDDVLQRLQAAGPVLPGLDMAKGLGNHG